MSKMLMPSVDNCHKTFEPFVDICYENYICCFVCGVTRFIEIIVHVINCFLQNAFVFLIDAARASFEDNIQISTRHYSYWQCNIGEHRHKQLVLRLAGYRFFVNSNIRKHISFPFPFAQKRSRNLLLCGRFFSRSANSSLWKHMWDVAPKFLNLWKETGLILAEREIHLYHRCLLPILRRRAKFLW